MRFLDVNEENNGRMPRGRRVMDYCSGGDGTNGTYFVTTAST
jgi:hypothetical protein